MRIYLIGYSYSGKTTMGKLLAHRLGYHFFDTDKAIELKYRTTIDMFFERYGEKAFRIIERQMLWTTAEMDNVVISTGGGTSCNDENIDFILRHGLSVYMEMSVDQILQRIAKARRGRPALKGLDEAQRREFISHQLAQREVFYRQANLTVQAMDLTPDLLIQHLTQSGIIAPSESR